MNFYPFNHKDVALVKDNKAVLNCRGHHLCGYVAFPVDRIPKEWYGDYNADALQYLSVHGGLTFCEVENDSEEYKKALEGLRNKSKAITESDFSKKIQLGRELEREFSQKAALLPGSFVVFGFDCTHLDDENDPNLKNPEYVMKLTESMETQLLSYAKRIDEWRAADRERRVAIMQEIINEAGEFKAPLGFGAMVDMLCGAKKFGETKEER